VIVIRGMTPEDVDGVVGLQRACFPPPFPAEYLWTREHLLSHLDKFPEGQFVAVWVEPTGATSACLGSGGEGAIVASASTSRISEAQWQAHLPWEETLGGFKFETYDPHGSTLYAADISVHPDYRGHGIARKLYKARFELCRTLGCARVGTACRIPDYHTFEGTQEQYVARVDVGGLADRTLTPLLKCGMELSGVIHEYMDDPESGNAAALLEWRP